jgi:hypothetical protein
MISVSSVGRPVREGYEEKGGHFKIAAYMGGQAESDPQAFLVHDLHRPGVVAPHFHHVRQFQVIVSNGVKLGRRDVPYISFHYADPSTPYGPIDPGEDEPLAFFTLRPEKSDGTYFLPGTRDKLEGKPGRNILCQVPDDAVDNELATLIERHEDGLAAYRVRIRPGEQVEGVSDAAAGGAYYLVMDGELEGDAEPLPRFSLLWVGPDEPAPALKAGSEGADVLILQFPPKRAS